MMNNKVIKLKSYKWLGIVILVLACLSFFSELLSLAIYQNKMTILDFLTSISTIPLGISLLISKEKTRNIVFAVGLFTAAAIQLLVSVTQSHAFSFIGIILAIAYAVLGLVAINEFKMIKVGYVTLAIVFAYSLFYSYFGGFILQYLYGIGSVAYSLLLFPSGILSQLVLICIAIFFFAHTEKKQPQNTICLNTNIIDFKTLLSFIENEHQTGKISDDEYNQKRAEIINKL